MNDLCLCSVIVPAKSNILFLVNDLDRLIIKHSTELDNRPLGTRTIGVSLGSITEQFDWFAGIKYTDYQDIDRHVSWCLGSLSKGKTYLFKQSKKQKRFVLNETKGVTIVHWFHCLVCRIMNNKKRYNRPFQLQAKVTRTMAILRYVQPLCTRPALRHVVTSSCFFISHHAFELYKRIR